MTEGLPEGVRAWRESGQFETLAGLEVFYRDTGPADAQEALLLLHLGRELPEGELDAMWALMRHRDGIARLPQVIGYIDERYRFHGRWIGALQRLDLPVLVLWGPKDPVAVPAIARLLADEIPGARLQWLEGLGHYPQLEDPAATAGALNAFLARNGPGPR